jgi:hypothetical protein
MGAGLGRLGWTVPSLKEQDLLDAAVRRAGSSDFGGEGFREGLGVLLDSLEREADLSTLGRLSARETVLRYLGNRLRLTEYRKQHPELADERIERPIFIIGLPRTGTTILFNLLSQDLANRPPLGWETEYPVPPPESETYDTDPRIKQAEKLLGKMDQVIPWLPTIHEFGALLPQECVPINAHEFLTVQFHITNHVPSYQAWFEQQDQLPSTHRDPANVMPSLASLHYALRSMNSDSVDPARCGRDVMDVWSLSLQRAVEARKRHRDKPGQFLDAYFEDTIRDPVDQLRRAYEHFGLELTETTRERMSTFLAANPRGSRGVHKYVREDFDLDLDEIRERCSEYCSEFNVPLSA